MRDAVEDEVEGRSGAVLVVVSGDLFADDGLDAEFFFEFPLKGLAGGLSGFDFAAGELPLQRMPIVLAALTDQDETLLFNESSNNGKTKS